jgi:hypothetical protein
MSKEEILSFNELQMLEMDKHKWIESEKRGCDVGVDGHLEWISKYASKFRKEWFDKNMNNGL